MRVIPLILVASLLVPATALAQNRQRVPPDKDRSVSGSAGDSPAAAVPREAPPPPPPPPPPSPPPPPPPPPPQRTNSGAAAPRSGSTAGDGSSGAQQRQRVPPEARRGEPRGTSPRGGTAVPRPPNQPPRRDNDRDRGRDGRTIYVPGPTYNSYYYYPRRYYPYGYGAFGLGYFYYDPYSWGPGYSYAYPPFRGYGYGYPTGELRLDVRPRDAEVYVDGYYAGRVDDFDGIFQSLDLEEGAYRIEIVAPGFAPLEFDVRIYPGRKTTYRGELLRLRP